MTDRYDRAMGLWPQPRRELDVETGFGTVHVHHYGARNGEPIVLLHGRAGCSNGRPRASRASGLRSCRAPGTASTWNAPSW